MKFVFREQLGAGVPSAATPGPRSAFSRKHREPRAGYATPEKQAWRTALWEQMVRHLTPSVRESSKVFLVETTAALEIEKVLSLGFNEENLHVCNVNPAIVATLKRQYPAISTYGVEADVALRRAFDAGIRFDAISLDLCGPVSKRTHDILHACRPVIDFVGSVGLTLLRGREPDTLTFEIPGSREDVALWTALIRRSFKVRRHFYECASTPRDVMRIGAPFFHLLMGECFWGKDSRGRTDLMTETPREEFLRGQIRGGGVYRSGIVTMMWLCFGLVQPIKWRPIGWQHRPVNGWAEWSDENSAPAFRRGVSRGFTTPSRI